MLHFAGFGEPVYFLLHHDPLFNRGIFTLVEVVLQILGLQHLLDNILFAIGVVFVRKLLYVKFRAAGA